MWGVFPPLTFDISYVIFTERAMAPHTPVLLPGVSHGWRSLEGCSPWGRWGLDTTERLHFYFLLSCFGEGNGNPLQCSCLENPRDGGAWWAAVYGVAQSRTRLKWLSSNVIFRIKKRCFSLFLKFPLCSNGLFCLSLNQYSTMLITVPS